MVDRVAESDVPFLGKAILLAERAHTGRGIWDVLLQEFNDEDKLAILSRACQRDVASHFHMSRFFVAREEGSNRPIAAACGFKYPDSSLQHTKHGLYAAIDELGFHLTDAADKEAWWKRLSFVEEAFPDCDYSNSWMLEAVYVDPAFRGRGLAEKVINAVLADGASRGEHKVLISCAVGNTPAFNLYTKLGFRLIGEGNSSECEAKLGSKGFYMLLKDM